ncbi:hypothetical protein [Actinomadura geliboluensis]|uniref:hypothetical protein n=1 Tax=Actinomadura geliboluensis TaxID=882440 RepID=UPI00371AC560
MTSLLTWRAAGLAVYGGGGNTFRNIHIADTLVYSGITIGTLTSRTRRPRSRSTATPERGPGPRVLGGARGLR